MFSYKLFAFLARAANIGWIISLLFWFPTLALFFLWFAVLGELIQHLRNRATE